MPRRLQILLAAIVLSFVDTAAPGNERTAQPAPNLERVVALKNGAIYRGEVVELVPDEYLTLRLRNGAEKTFLWKDIESQWLPNSGKPAPGIAPPAEPLARAAPNGAAATGVAAKSSIGSTERANKPPTLEHVVGRGPHSDEGMLPAPPKKLRADADDEEQTAQSPTSPRSAKAYQVIPNSKADNDEFVKLDLTSTDPKIRLEYIGKWAQTEDPVTTPAAEQAESWDVACKYPCGALVNRKATFRVAGPDIMESNRFTLPEHAKSVNLIVRPGRPVAAGFGVTLDVLGSSLIVAGLTASVYYAVNLKSTTDHSLDDVLRGGLASVLLGGGVLAGGIALTVVGRTRVTVSRAASEEVALDD